MPTHRYEIDGDKIPSVTRIIGLCGENKRPLIHAAWKLGMEGKNYREVWGAAADAGTAAHALAEAHMLKRDMPSLAQLPEEVQKGALDRFENLKLWLGQNHYEPVATEIAMISRNNRFGGTIDNVGLINGRPALVDLKSRTLYKDQIIQVAAYTHLWDENHPDMPIETVHILGMSEGFHHHLISDRNISHGFAAFLSLNDLYQRLSEIKV